MLARWTISRVRRTTIEARGCRTLSNIPCPPNTRIPVKRVSIHQQHNAVRSKQLQSRRTFFTEAIPTVLIPPTIFTALLLGLWTWKCFWIVLMQDKLLYIAWLPPFARSEKIADYEAQCGPVRWEEKQIRSLDGTKLTVCEGRMKSADASRSSAAAAGSRTGAESPAGRAQRRRRRVVICYFQGNGGSTPMRLPLLSDTLRTATSATRDDNVEFIVVALSYRGYWTSSGRATQSGIEQDAQAFLAWASRSYAEPETDLRVVLWGHSLGSAIASTALATYLTRRHDSRNLSVAVPITGLILEAPTSSTKDMLISLYPQKWLPYRYLWPFLWNNWNISLAMERLAKWGDRYRVAEAMDEQGEEVKAIGSGCGIENRERSSRLLPPILMLSAEKDEVIPPHAADQLEADAKRMGLALERKHVVGAMHTEALVKVEGKKAMMNFLLGAI